jgi:hypothetical protein
LKLLERLGPKVYVDRFFDSPHWGVVLQHIETGNSEWLLVARAMKPGVDAGSSEELRIGIATALARAPANVLPVLSNKDSRSTWSIGSVCSAPFISPGKTWLIRYKARAIKAVAGVRDPALRDKRAICVQTLRKIDLSKPAGFYE